MLSAVGEASYIKVATASITANIAAIISHVPGGLGVLEATIVHVMPGVESIAAVIAYRVIYYFIPLAIGNYFLAGRLGRNPVLWAVLTVIPVVNFVFLYVAMYRVVFYVLDRLNELSGRRSAT